uniref:Uncharacterized protein n=1 Tax=Octopus bimaculoides TaxID=37653 RepID=A0A0L8HIL2_OCTBM
MALLKDCNLLRASTYLPHYLFFPLRVTQTPGTTSSPHSPFLPTLFQPIIFLGLHLHLLCHTSASYPSHT